MTTQTREKIYDHIDVLDSFIKANPFSERMLNYAVEHRALAETCIADPFNFDAHAAVAEAARTLSIYTRKFA